MVKLLIGLLIVTVASVTTGFATAQKKPSQANLTGYTGYTKDQCKNGGWETLGFRNQGQCVSYFASGGRAPGYTN